MVTAVGGVVVYGVGPGEGEEAGRVEGVGISGLGLGEIGCRRWMKDVVILRFFL